MSPANGMPTCREVVELVTSYLEGALTEAEEVRFEEHLAMCDGCADYVDQMRTAIRLTGRIAQESLDAEACTRLTHAFRSWVGSTEPGG